MGNATFLTRAGSIVVPGGAQWLAHGPEEASAVASLFNQLQEFKTLSSSLDLTRAEQQTLLSLDAGAWEFWRRLASPPLTPFPPLLRRRLGYAVPLLRRMAATAAMAGAIDNAQNDFSSRSM